MECRACDAGITSGQCMSKNVVYSVFCALCEAEYVGETERTVRDRLTEHHGAQSITIGRRARRRQVHHGVVITGYTMPHLVPRVNRSGHSAGHRYWPEKILPRQSPNPGGDVHSRAAAKCQERLWLDIVGQLICFVLS